MVSTRSKNVRLTPGLTVNKPRYAISDSSHRHRFKDRRRYAVSVVAHSRRKPLK